MGSGSTGALSKICTLIVMHVLSIHNICKICYINFLQYIMNIAMHFRLVYLRALIPMTYAKGDLILSFPKYASEKYRIYHKL